MPWLLAWSRRAKRHKALLENAALVRRFRGGVGVRFSPTLQPPTTRAWCCSSTATRLEGKKGYMVRFSRIQRQRVALKRARCRPCGPRGWLPMPSRGGAERHWHGVRVTGIEIVTHPTQQRVRFAPSALCFPFWTDTCERAPTNDLQTQPPASLAGFLWRSPSFMVRSRKREESMITLACPCSVSPSAVSSGRDKADPASIGRSGGRREVGRGQGRGVPGNVRGRRQDSRQDCVLAPRQRWRWGGGRQGSDAPYGRADHGGDQVVSAVWK